MSLNADALAYLLAKGFSAEEMVEFARVSERKKDITGAERQARHRAKKRERNTVTVTRDPPIDRTHTPSSDISPDGENQNHRARSKRDEFPKPDWADPQVWSDWLDVRKTKKARNTATAYAGFLADIDKLTNPQWPPGRLLAYAVTRSWAGIFEPKEGYPTDDRDTRPARIQSPPGNRGTRPNPLVDILAGIAAEERAERGSESDLGTWPPVRAIGSG